jgi:hypothetical protein
MNDFIMSSPKSYKQFHTFFSPDDWQEILNRAEKTHMKPTTFIRNMALKGMIVVFDKMAMNSLTLAINRIGTNINQIVHLANEVHSVNLNDVKLLADKLDKIENEIEEYQRRIEHGGEKF